MLLEFSYFWASGGATAAQYAAHLSPSGLWPISFAPMPAALVPPKGKAPAPPSSSESPTSLVLMAPGVRVGGEREHRGGHGAGGGGGGQRKPSDDPRDNQHNPRYATYWGPQTAHPATSSTAPAHQLLGSVNAQTTPAGAPAAAADRTQRPDATCEGKNG